jgi:hypothetical protein
VEGFFCKVCCTELSNHYMHCLGCENILQKDFNICSNCHKLGCYKSFFQMHQTNGEGLSTVNHTGSAPNTQCQCENVVDECIFCEKCTACCTCHQRFTLHYRFMTLKQEQELLEKSRSIVSAYDTQPSPEGVAAAASAIRSGGGPQAAQELQSETAELSSAMSTGLTITQQASDFSDPSSSNDQIGSSHDQSDNDTNAAINNDDTVVERPAEESTSNDQVRNQNQSDNSTDAAENGMVIENPAQESTSNDQGSNQNQSNDSNDSGADDNIVVERQAEEITNQNLEAATDSIAEVRPREENANDDVGADPINIDQEQETQSEDESGMPEKNIANMASTEKSPAHCMTGGFLNISKTGCNRWKKLPDAGCRILWPDNIGFVPYRHNLMTLQELPGRNCLLESLVVATGMKVDALEGVPKKLEKLMKDQSGLTMGNLAKVFEELKLPFRLRKVNEVNKDRKWTNLFKLTEGIFIVLALVQYQEGDDKGNTDGHFIVFDAWRDLLILGPGHGVLLVTAEDKANERHAKEFLLKQYSLRGPLYAYKLVVSANRVRETHFNTPEHFDDLAQMRMEKIEKMAKRKQCQSESISMYSKKMKC